MREVVVARSADLGEEPLAVSPTALAEAAGGDVGPGLGADDGLVLWRLGRLVLAAVDECPHHVVALSGGWVMGDCLICPGHGWLFGPDGRCRQIPLQDPVVPKPGWARLRMVEAGERDGQVFVRPETATPRPKRYFR